MIPRRPAAYVAPCAKVLLVASVSCAVVVAVACDDADVSACGDGERVVADGHTYCAFDETQVAAGGSDCPSSLPHRIPIGGALVCADRALAPADVPSSVCEAISGCDLDVDAGPDLDADTRDAEGDSRLEDGGGTEHDASGEDDMGAPSGSIVQVAGGDFHTCVRRDTGRVACWGANSSLQRGLTLDPEADPPFEPTLVPGLPESAIDLSAGRYHSCAAMTGGDVWCWGANGSGQSVPTSAETDSVAGRVVGVTGAVEVAAGQRSSCARLADGTVTCWGERLDGSDDVRPRAIEGISDAVEIDTGLMHVCVRRRAGRVLCWGLNREGQLAAPVEVESSFDPLEVSDLAGVEGLATGAAHSCALVAGTLSCWGGNSFGEVGFAPPPTTVRVPTAVDGLAGVLEVAAGGADLAGGHTCARRTSDVLCWGQNQHDQTGGRSSGPEPWTIAITASQLGLGSRHSCLVDRDSRVFCWGNNGDGQLGFETAAVSTTPTPAQVFDIP